MAIRARDCSLPDARALCDALKRARFKARHGFTRRVNVARMLRWLRWFLRVHGFHSLHGIPGTLVDRLAGFDVVEAIAATAEGEVWPHVLRGRRAWKRKPKRAPGF